MRLSNVLLAAMLATTYDSLAQDSTVNMDLDSISKSNNLKNSVEIYRDSIYHKKVALFYAKRRKKELRKAKRPKLVQENIYAEKVIRSYHNCPGCGRG